jgi:hypothetical protein
MTARTLLGLFPRAWRERYGDEFVTTAGDNSLRAQQVIDVLFAAADAWISADVRRAVQPLGSATVGGNVMSVKMLMCRSNARYTTRDAALAAGVMIGLTIVLALGANWAEREGAKTVQTVLNSLVFFGPLLVSLPLWLTKGQPWRGQALIIGGTLIFLSVIGWFASTL